MNAPVRGRSPHGGLLLLLGCMGVLPDILLGSLSSGFIDHVLVGRDSGRALPILVCCLLFTLAAFALDYTHLRLLKVEMAVQPDSHHTVTLCVRLFTILLNAGILALIQPLLLLPCGLLGVLVCLLRRTGLTPEASAATQAVFRTGTLFVSGVFVMSNRITMGELYAASLFSGAVFSQGLALLYRELPLPPQEEPSPPFSARRLLRGLVRDRRLLLAIGLCAAVNMAGSSLSLTLQRMNLGSCIPSGDLDNLLRNCMFACLLAAVGFCANKGNTLGLQQLFQGYVPHCIQQRLHFLSRQAATALLGCYFALYLGQYNRLLAGQLLSACLIVSLCCLFSSLSPAQRLRWGGSLERLYDLMFKRVQGLLTVYVYFVLTLEVVQLSAADLVLFLTIFGSVCAGARDMNKITLAAVNAGES